MSLQEQIKNYIDSLAQPKCAEMHSLHNRVLTLLPGCTLWFLDGKDANGKVVSNPNIGYGQQTLKYAEARPDGRVGRGKTKEFYQIGISANTTGISVYIMGLDDKKYLAEAYGMTIGKASVTGYCIKFKTLKDINIDVLESAILDGVEKTQ